MYGYHKVELKDAVVLGALILRIYCGNDDSKIPAVMLDAFLLLVSMINGHIFVESWIKYLRALNYCLVLPKVGDCRY